MNELLSFPRCHHTPAEDTHPHPTLLIGEEIFTHPIIPRCDVAWRDQLRRQPGIFTESSVANAHFGQITLTLSQNYEIVYQDGNSTLSRTFGSYNTTAEASSN